MNIQRLNVRIDQVGLLVNMIIIIIKLIMMMTIIKVMMIMDQVEEDLLTEKLKIKKVSDDLNQTFEDMINMSV